MRNYEDAILDRQENKADQCSSCPYKGRCNNECDAIQEIYNPVILAAAGRYKE